MCPLHWTFDHWKSQERYISFTLSDWDMFLLSYPLKSWASSKIAEEWSTCMTESQYGASIWYAGCMMPYTNLLCTLTVVLYMYVPLHLSWYKRTCSGFGEEEYGVASPWNLFGYSTMIIMAWFFLNLSSTWVHWYWIWVSSRR
jgi:hypothetical protein